MSVSVATDTGVLTKFKAAHASISQVDLTGPPQIDRTVEVLYDQGSFNVRIDGIAGPLGQERELTQQEKQALLPNLKEELGQHPQGVDLLALETFVELLERDLASRPSDRFTNVRFGDIAMDVTGAIVWHVGLGVDVAGTIHDRRGRITFEQHVVTMPPGPFTRLSHADRLSLAAAIEKLIADANAQARPINKLWVQVLDDLKK